MSDAKKDSTPQQPTTYGGTVTVNIQGRDYLVPVPAPPMNATLEDLEKALKHNRDLLKRAQDDMQKAVYEHTYLFKPPMLVNFDSPTQTAIMAHLNISVLIPLINIRGGNASYDKPETFHVKQRIEIMRGAAERTAHMEQYQKTKPVETAVMIVAILGIVMTILLSSS